MKIPALIFLALFLPACKPIEFLGPGNQDFLAHLCNGYILARTSAYQSMIAPEAGGGLGLPIIEARVLECNFNERYIVAKRQGLKRRSPHNPADTYMEPDPTVFDYWILDTTAPLLYGPFTESEFTQKRAAMGISSDLRLKNIYEFEPNPK